MIRWLLPIALIAPGTALAQETSFYSYIDAAIWHPPQTRAEMEAIIDAPLNRRGGSTSNNYEGKARLTTDSMVTMVDFTEPATAEAGAGATLVFVFQGIRCVRVGEILDRYPGLKPESGDPNERDGSAYWGGRAEWGRYAFGFEARRLGCLQRFVLSVDKPPSGLPVR